MNESVLGSEPVANIIIDCRLLSAIKPHSPHHIHWPRHSEKLINLYFPIVTLADKAPDWPDMILAGREVAAIFTFGQQ